MTEQSSSRCVAITGGAGGIGQAIAAHLERLGRRVYVLDREGARTQTGVFVPCDVLDRDSVDAAVETVYQDEPGPVDLICAAGIVEDDVAAEELSEDLVHRVMGVNFHGTFSACQAFGRRLLEHGTGSIVLISSMSGNLIVNYPQRQSIYNSSKAAVTALAKSLAVEWGPRGVRVNALSPGYVDTPLNSLKAHMHEGWRAGTVLGRFASTQEIADAAEFLLSDRASYCTGTELVVDGGYSLR